MFRISHAIAVKKNLKPDATVTLSGPVTFCASGKVTLTAPVSAGYSYEWFKNNTLISGANSSTYMAESSGNFKVKVTDAFGCYKFSSPVQ